MTKRALDFESDGSEEVDDDFSEQCDENEITTQTEPNNVLPRPAAAPAASVSCLALPGLGLAAAPAAASPPRPGGRPAAPVEAQGLARHFQVPGQLVLHRAYLLGQELRFLQLCHEGLSFGSPLLLPKANSPQLEVAQPLHQLVPAVGLVLLWRLPRFLLLGAPWRPPEEPSQLRHHSTKVSEGDYVLVEFRAGRVTPVFHVGKILSDIDSDGDHQVTYYRKKACRDDLVSFTLPSIPDLKTVSHKDIKVLLPKPISAAVTRRPQDIVSFDFDFSTFKLC
ncbi:Myosin-1 [Frankliniella fusca]|uniref:Myosin-1 n=1 Tax=Frankliniella fusca TaxID=407009 RepID=A0AAE1LFF3_9NEOP|nr:Myosin-1 [Frankliniella fusca]